MKTKKRIALFIAALALTATVVLSSVAFVGCGDASGTIVLNGSTSMEKVITNLMNAYMDEHEGVKITYSPTGSGAGITAAKSGTADMGLASRDLKAEDGNDISATPIAIDAVALIVDKDNPLENVTTDQVKALFANGTDIANSSIGHGVGRDSTSGTRECFDDALGIETDYDSSAQQLSSNNAVVTAVTGDQTALGYVSLDSVTSAVKVIGYNGVKASSEAVVDGTYTLKRNFNLILPAGGYDALSDVAQDFYDFCLSPEGQAIVVESGNVAVGPVAE